MPTHSHGDEGDNIYVTPAALAVTTEVVTTTIATITMTNNSNDNNHNDNNNDNNTHNKNDNATSRANRSGNNKLSEAAPTNNKTITVTIISMTISKSIK